MADEKVRVAAVQASPVFLDREATVEKACGLIAEAGRNEARLVAFTESFIPGYPDWVWAVPAGEDGVLRELYARFLDNAVAVPGEAIEKICKAAKLAKTYVVLGVSEVNSESSQASMYNTLVYIDDSGQIMGKHRKLVPTGGERLVWAQGDGSTLGVYTTPLGRLGGLICWENYMPLARYAMYSWGAQIYVAATWDRGDDWIGTLRHIAREGRMYVIGIGMCLRVGDIPDALGLKEKYYGGRSNDEWINVGDSAIIAPSGEIIAGPVREREEILYADLDPAQMRGSKWMLDVAGHYARPDVFHLTVNRGEAGSE
jgi:nitrilase